MEDTQLLAEYSRTKSEQAFSQLVRRHLGLVLAAARRQVSDETLAEDVAQAVFLVLADKASSLGKDVVLAGWLIRTTRFIASRALRTEFRRRRREQAALAMQDLDPSESTWKRIAPHLDEALARLGELDRNALLLRFAEGCNHREVGIALGLSEEAAKKRVNRALDHLRTYFSTRGIAISIAVLGVFLTDRLTACSPEAVAISIAKASLRQSTASVVSIQLAKAMRYETLRQTLQLAALVSLMVPLLCLIALQLVRNPQNTPPLVPTAEENNSAKGLAQRGIVGTGTPISSAMTDSLRLRIVSKDSEEALPGAKVLLSFVVDGEPRVGDDLVTDAEGYCWVPIPKGHSLRMDIGAQAEGYAHRFITWRSDWSFPRPSEHVLRMSPAETIGGFVLNTHGNPVSDVVIWLQYGINENPEVEPLDQFERPGYLLRRVLAKTDAHGRWTSSIVSKEVNSLALTFEHPRYVLEAPFWINRLNTSTDTSNTLSLLRSGSHVARLETGHRLLGRVMTLKDEPISNAQVMETSTRQTAKTDEHGRFSMASLPQSEVKLTATADGFVTKRLQARGAVDEVMIRMETGLVARIRIVDEQGEPITGAMLVIEDRSELHALVWQGRSDANGRAEWDGVPHRESLSLSVIAAGYQSTRELPLIVDGTEQEVSLQLAERVEGMVVDAESGAPVIQFKAIPGRGMEKGDFNRSSLSYGTNGHYQLSFFESGSKVVRFEAEGYEPEMVIPTRLEKLAHKYKCDAHLRRVGKGSTVHGVAVYPDGSIATNVEVGICNLDGGVVIRRGQFLDESAGLIQRTDSHGRFAFHNVRSAHTLVAISARGTGRIPTGFSEPLRVVLHPFGTIQGVVQHQGKPVANQGILLMDPSFTLYRGAPALDVPRFETRTDEHGVFEIDFVPPGDYQIHRTFGVGEVSAAEPASIRVHAGQVTKVNPGMPDPQGKTITGRLQLSESIAIGDWKDHLIHQQLSVKTVPLPAPPGTVGEALDLWKVTWFQSPEGQEYVRRQVRHTVEVLPDGAFTVSGVLPGRYQLSFIALPAEFARKPIPLQIEAKWNAHFTGTVDVTESNLAGQTNPLDLGQLTLKVYRK